MILGKSPPTSMQTMPEAFLCFSRDGIPYVALCGDLVAEKEEVKRQLGVSCLMSSSPLGVLANLWALLAYSTPPPSTIHLNAQEILSFFWTLDINCSDYFSPYV